MVATTQVRFLVGANYMVDLKKNPLAGETGVRGFSKPGEGFFFLMKTVGRSYPHRLSFWQWKLPCCLLVSHVGIRNQQGSLL
jgi:hypothetical protein